MTVTDQRGTRSMLTVQLLRWAQSGQLVRLSARGGRTMTSENGILLRSRDLMRPSCDRYRRLAWPAICRPNRDLQQWAGPDIQLASNLPIWYKYLKPGSRGVGLLRGRGLCGVLMAESSFRCACAFVAMFTLACGCSAASESPDASVTTASTIASVGGDTQSPLKSISEVGITQEQAASMREKCADVNELSPDNECGLYVLNLPRTFEPCVDLCVSVMLFDNSAGLLQVVDKRPDGVCADADGPCFRVSTDENAIGELVNKFAAETTNGSDISSSIVSSSDVVSDIVDGLAIRCG